MKLQSLVPSVHFFHCSYSQAIDDEYGGVSNGTIDDNHIKNETPYQEHSFKRFGPLWSWIILLYQVLNFLTSTITFMKDKKHWICYFTTIIVDSKTYLWKLCLTTWYNVKSIRLFENVDNDDENDDDIPVKLQQGQEKPSDENGNVQDHMVKPTAKVSHKTTIQLPTM